MIVLYLDLQIIWVEKLTGKNRLVSICNFICRHVLGVYAPLLTVSFYYFTRAIQSKTVS